MAHRRIAIPGAVVFRLLAEAQPPNVAAVAAATRENVNRLWDIEELYSRVLAFKRRVRSAGARAAIVELHGLADDALLAADADDRDRRTEHLLRCELQLRKAIEVGLQDFAAPTMKALLGLAKAKRPFDNVRRAAKGMKATGWDREAAHAALVERFPSPDGPTKRTIRNILDRAGFPRRAPKPRAAEKTPSYPRRRKSKGSPGKNRF